MSPPHRKIIHIDMDAFFASVEQREDPSLRGKPVAVGGSRARGVVAAASYEARAYGVRSAMPSLTAARLCPDLIFVKPQFDLYREVSHQIRAIFFRYTDLVEPLSLDEAYLDVTENKQGLTAATQIARQIRREIWEETQLTASAGISVNKFLAKVASGLNKPNGMTLIPPDRVESFLEKLPIHRFHGIGDKTAAKMKRLGIHTGADLKACTEYELARHFGKAGRFYYRIVRALDDRPVHPDRIRKSVGAERTFSEDLTTATEMLERLRPITQLVADRLAATHTSGKTLTLKIKSTDFVITTRSRTTSQYLQQAEDLWEIVHDLLHTPGLPAHPVRLLGLSVSSLDNEDDGLPRQLTIDFGDTPQDPAANP
ncbi:MAG: DNA polymerase IV [Bacteroidia bacterium]|jgi:DNA polymerase-4|nr:DNA polymerase IV [Bacteroidia bacterium]